MSRTGYAPWDDDIGADQLERLMQTTKLPKVIRETLAHQVSDVPAARAARAICSVIILLGNAGSWPIDELDSDLKLAYKRLTECSAVEEDAEFKSLIEKECKLLDMMLQGELLPTRLEMLQSV
jgi:hypothetical protein